MKLVSRFSALFPAAPIFFSQECFFGRGLSQIDDRFSVALCKDDYLLPQLPGLDRAPVYRMDGIKVVVGSNHLANRLAGRCDSGEADAEKRRPDATVADGNRRVSPAYAGFETGTLKGLEWKWYHFGSGHHLTVPSPPTDPERFYFDAHWTASNLSYLVSLRDAGYTFFSISDFVAHIADSDLKPLPFVVEGGWNIRRSKGVFQWMGGASIPWQDSPSILAMASRSRERLLACEAMAREMGLPASSGCARRARERWAKQIMAECSDPHGWLPTQGEVRFGRSAAEDVLREGSRLLAELSLAHKGGPQDSPALPYGAAIDLDLGIALIGQGETVQRRVSKKLHLLETRVMPQGGVAGVVFRRDTTDVTYCCSGMESQPTTFRLRYIAMPDVYLPLANGLISLGERRFLIRVNTYGVTAAKLSREDNTVTFQAATAVRPLRQRFLVYEGASEDAVSLANLINAAGNTQSVPSRRHRVVSSISDV